MGKGCKSLFSCLPEDHDHFHPWFFVSQGKNLQSHTFYNISKNEYIKRNIPEFWNKGVFATSYGWLMLIDFNRKPRDCCLVNPESNETVQLPSIDSEHGYYQGILSKPPTHPDCHVLLISVRENFLLFCQLGDEKFIRRTKIFEEGKLTTAINFKGKIYAWMHESGNIVEVDFVGPYVLLNQMVNPRGQLCQIPWPSRSPWHADYLVESCGELLFVHMVSYRHSAETAYFRIFKINTVEKECEELRSIGDRTIFLCMFGGMSLLCANESCFKKNSIYYSWPSLNLWVYDIEDRSKTLIKSYPYRSGIRRFKSWIML